MEGPFGEGAHWESRTGRCGVTESGKLAPWKGDSDIVGKMDGYFLKSCMRDVRRRLDVTAQRQGVDLTYPEYQFTWNGFRWT